MTDLVLISIIYIAMGIITIMVIWPNEDLIMTTYRVVSKDGRTEIISARTYSDAYQQAVDFCGDDMIESFEEF